MGKGIIKQIFKDHWGEFKEKYGYKIRGTVIKEVQKMIECGSIENGYIEYKCKECGSSKKVGFRCRSRFCTSCGKVYVDNWAEDGFYVHAKGIIENAKKAAKYVGRYTGRPAISESRIIKYDGEKVTYYYQRHEDGKRVEVELEVEEFIKKVIMHIPEKHFKMIRYYGIYARNSKHKDKFLKVIDEKVKESLKKIRTWRYRILKSFGHDPLECEKCKAQMELHDINYKKYGSVMEIYYKRIIQEGEKEIDRVKRMYDAVKETTDGRYEPLFT